MRHIVSLLLDIDIRAKSPIEEVKILDGEFILFWSTNEDIDSRVMGIGPLKILSDYDRIIAERIIRKSAKRGIMIFKTTEKFLDRNGANNPLLELEVFALPLVSLTGRITKKDARFRLMTAMFNFESTKRAITDIVYKF